MSLVLKITNPTGSASGGVAANSSRYYQLSDGAYVVTNNSDTITSAVVGSTTYATSTLIIQVGYLARSKAFDILLSS